MVEPKVLVVEPSSSVWWLRLAMDQVDQLDSQHTRRAGEAILTAAHLFAQTGGMVDYRQTFDLWLAQHVLTPQRHSRIIKLQLDACDIEGARLMLDDIPTDSAEYIAAWCAVAITQYEEEDLEGSSATIIQARQALALINDPARLHDAQLALVRTLVVVNDLDVAATQVEALDDQDAWTTRYRAASVLG